MSREMLQLAEALASEKNVEAEVVFQALEFALSTAAKKKADREHMDVRVEIDRDTGEYHTYRRWLIVADEDYTYPDLEKTIEEIQEEIPGTDIQIGDYYEETLPNEGPPPLPCLPTGSILLRYLLFLTQGKSMSLLHFAQYL